MQLVVTEERLVGPKIQLLIDELLQLRIIKDKVDHPRKGSKDLSDAVCGAVYNAVALTARNIDQEVKIYNYSSYRTEEEEMEEERERYNPNVIRPPESRIMPHDIMSYLQTEGSGDSEQRFIDNFTIL
jgi:hypothetical protein